MNITITLYFRWLAVDEDDGLIVREITAGGSQLLSMTTYNVTIKTGDVRGAGTDANAYIKVMQIPCCVGVHN